MRRSEGDALVREAIRIRRWANDLLSSTGSPPRKPEHKDMFRARVTTPGALLGISPAAWRLFLDAERCALPLYRRIRERRLERAVAPAGVQAIDAYALEEMQRVLSARAQLARLSSWAVEHAERVVVLKGAAAATDDLWAVDLSDVDLWAVPHAGQALLEHLRQAGFAPKPSETQYHHPPLRDRQLVAVEIHREIPLAHLDPSWSARVLPLSEHLPGLARMDPADHLWHVLVHAAVHHVERRGRLRDQLLLSHAHSLCSPGQSRDVHGRARRHPQARRLLLLLGHAAAVGSGRRTADAFTCVAAARYLAMLAAHPRGRVYPIAKATVSVLEGPRAVLGFVTDARRAKGTCGWSLVERLRRRSPRFGGLVVLILRGGARMMALILAFGRFRAARRLAHDRLPPDNAPPLFPVT